MIAKNIRIFIDNFLIEDKSKETLEVKNLKNVGVGMTEL